MRLTAARPQPDARVAEHELSPVEDRVVQVPQPPFDLLYRLQRAKLLNFLRRHAPSDSADDLLQTTFLRVLALAPERLQAIDCPEGYLYQSARNLARDAAKTASRRPAHQLWDGEENLLPVQDAIAGLEARDMLKRLEHAMTRLKPLTREIFMAHRLDGYTYLEIAARTGLSVKGVEKQMSRAIAHLDRLLTDR